MCTLVGPGCTQRESIEIAGSSTVLPIVSKAAERYVMDHPEVNVIVNAGGSGVGVNQVGAGQVDIGMISRDLTETERLQYPGVSFLSHTIGQDAVIPVVSSEVYDAGVHRLTLREIARIYKGEVSNWNEVGGPDLDILVIDKEKSRGTRHEFMAVVMGDREADAPGADLVLGSNNEEQTAIVQSNAAIGMLSYAWLSEDVKGISIVGPDGTVFDPVLENILNGTFPITRALLLVTDGEPAGHTGAFIQYLLSEEGQNMVEEEGYVRIR